MNDICEFNVPFIGADQDLITRLAEEAGVFLPDSHPRSHRTIEKQPNRRSSVRYTVTFPAVCFPILPTGEIDTDCQLDGIITNVSNQGMGLRVAARGITTMDSLLVAISLTGNEYSFTCLEVTNVVKTETDSMILNTKLGGPYHALFQSNDLNPNLDRLSMQYSLPYSELQMKSLCSIGATQRICLDRVLVCPSCRALPTFRKGCSVCFSSHVEKSKMIHHYACAHVDFVDQFEADGEMVCPKCRGRKMIVGADYEFLEGPHQCLECGHSDLETIHIGHCMNCENRFPFDSAVSLDIVGYRVNRMDLLDIIDTV